MSERQKRIGNMMLTPKVAITNDNSHHHQQQQQSESTIPDKLFIEQLQSDVALAVSNLVENDEIMVDGDKQTYSQQTKVCYDLCHFISQLRLGYDTNVVEVRSNKRISDANFDSEKENQMNKDVSSSSQSSRGSKQQPLALHEQQSLSARIVMADVPSTSTRRLTPIVGSLMSNRVENEMLLPATMDERANLEAMEDTTKAMILTRTSLAAAEFYCHMLLLPGAVAMGLVQMDTIVELSNVMRRWTTELCGRELHIKGKSTNNKKNEKKQRKSKDVEDCELSDADEEMSKPRKKSRSRASKKLVSFSQNDPEDDDDNDDGMFGLAADSIEEKSDQLSPLELFQRGMDVSSVLVQIPIQKEFFCWSSEAQEVVIKTVCLILATTKALIASRSSVDCDINKANEISTKAANSLERCILQPNNNIIVNPPEKDHTSEDHGTQADDNINDLANRHEVTKYLLRGLLPLVYFDEVVPNGENGKVSAGNAAFQVLVQFMIHLSNDITSNPQRWPKSITSDEPHLLCSDVSNTSTPPAGTSSSAMTHQTPNASHRNPSSSTMKKGSVPGLMSPKLKSSKKTPATRSVMPNTNTFPLRPIYSLLYGFLQKVIVKTEGRERVANRCFAVRNVVCCLEHLPHLERNRFLHFVVQLCESKLSVHRLVGAEVVGSIFSEEWLWVEHNNNQNITGNSQYNRRKNSIDSSHRVDDGDDEMPIAILLFGALKGRLMDRSPSIRSASASALTEILRQVGSESNISTSKETDPSTSRRSIHMTRTVSEYSFELLDILRRRIEQEEKATVRRSCLLAIVELLLLSEIVDEIPTSLSEVDIRIISKKCKDISLQTRKAAAEGISRLLEYFSMQTNRPDILSSLERSWSTSVLTMVLDSDTSCSNTAVELFERFVLRSILSEDDETSSLKQRSSWRILALTGGLNNGASRNVNEALRVALGKNIVSSTSNTYLVRIFKLIHHAALRTLNKSNEINLLSENETDVERHGVWALFEAVMGYQNQEEIQKAIKRSKVDLSFLEMSWETMLELFRVPDVTRDSQQSHLQSSMQKCLQVLAKLADLLDLTSVERTRDDLQAIIADFSLPPNIIGAACVALVAATLSISTKKDEDPKTNCIRCINYLYSKCENEIESFNVASEKIPMALYTLGELVMIGFTADVDDDKQSQVEATPRKKKEKCSDGINGMLVLPSSQLINIVQALMAETLPGRDIVENPTRIRAHAFVTFGKLCLRNEKLAQKSLNIFARELYESDITGDGLSVKISRNPAVQSNVILIFGDLCIRYTNLVDQFLPVMAACMQAGTADLEVNALGSNSSSPIRSALARKHAIIVLSDLILQDFIKWRGLLFHRFLVACADEEDDVADLAQGMLTGPLLSKQPRLFANQFVESLFVLNKCTAHPIYKAAASAGDGGSGISVGFDGINLTGEYGRIRRMKMYYLMLSKITEEEKIGVTARIAKDVLDSASKGSTDLYRVCVSNGVASDNTNNLTQTRFESAYNVLSDTLTILASPMIRVGKQKNNEPDDDIEDSMNEKNNDTTVKKVEQAKGRLLSNVSRKHMIDILLPILCSLKQLLQQSCNCLLKDLMLCLVEYYNLYKDDIKECLASDPTLLQEIEYDARQYNNEKKAR